MKFEFKLHLNLKNISLRENSKNSLKFKLCPNFKQFQKKLKNLNLTVLLTRFLNLKKAKIDFKFEIHTKKKKSSNSTIPMTDPSI